MYQVQIRVLLGPLAFEFSSPTMYGELLAYKVLEVLHSTFNYGPLRVNEIRLVKMPI